MVLLIVGTLGIATGSPLPHLEDRRLRIVLAQDAPPPHPLMANSKHDAPVVEQMEPNHESKEHLEKIYRKEHETAEVVYHQDKLEHKIVHLKEQVKSLSNKMTKEEAMVAIYRAESQALDEKWDKKEKKDLSVE